MSGVCVRVQMQKYKRKIKEKLLSWLVDHSWGDVKEVLSLLENFFSLIEQIIHKYTFLVKIIKVIGQNKLSFGYLSVIPCLNPNTSSNDLLKFEVQVHVVFENNDKKGEKYCSNSNTNFLLFK